MGIQIIVKTKTVSDIETVLGRIASECEIFAIDTTNWGVSIPGNVIDSVGEQHIEATLEKLEYFDLWAGAWKSARPR